MASDGQVERPSAAKALLAVHSPEKRTACLHSNRGWGNVSSSFSKREADVMRQLPETRFTSAAGSSRARSSIDRGRSANAAGPASNVPCLWHGRSCRANQRLRDATLLRIRDARPPCCASLSWRFPHCWPTNVGWCQHGYSPSHPQPDNGSGTKKRRRCLYLIALPPLKVRGHVQMKLSSRGIHKKRRATGTMISVSTLHNVPPKTPKELSNESAKSESRRPAGRPRWSARWWWPEPEPATRPAKSEARSGRTARWSRWRASWWPERLVYSELVYSFSRFFHLAPLRRGFFFGQMWAGGIVGFLYFYVCSGRVHHHA
jgi:hypothetical protein